MDGPAGLAALRFPSGFAWGALPGLAFPLADAESLRSAATLTSRRSPEFGSTVIAVRL